MKQLEGKLQENCFKWFDYAYPKYRNLFFAIPNGSKRDIRTAMALKRQGVRAGVSDAFLAIPRLGHSGIFIEFKIGTNKQTDLQKHFQDAIEFQGYRYIVIYSFDEFEKEIKNYLL